MEQNNPGALYTPARQRDNALNSVESQRAVHEVQTALVVARRFPRDVGKCVERIMNACQRPSLAEAAVYQYARGGTNITGPSIRLAETVAQQWGNFDFGFHELHRGRDEESGVPYSEIRAFAWDMESNTRRALQFRVSHWRDTKGGGYALKDERDIYELIANQAQRRVRSCIMAVIPGDVFDDAVTQCEVTLRAKADTSPEALIKLQSAFNEFGVTRSQIEARIQRRLEAITPAQVVQLKKVYVSLRDGMSSPSDWFETTDEAAASSVANGPIDPFEKQPAKKAAPKAKPSPEPEADNLL